MKALIRNPGETITSDNTIEGIDWNTGAPLTNKTWCGGPYRLVDNYVPPVEEGQPEIYEEIPCEEEPQVEDGNDYVIINGVRYSKEELRSLIE